MESFYLVIPSFANPINIALKIIPIKTGAIIETQLRLPGLKYLSVSELVTTDTELSAMASPANSGFSTSPRLANIRVAIGMPVTL